MKASLVRLLQLKFLLRHKLTASTGHILAGRVLQLKPFVSVLLTVRPQISGDEQEK